MASISTRWPFQRVSRPGSITTGRPSGRRHSRGEADDALGADALGIEAAEVDAALDDAQPLGRHAIGRRGMLGDEMRDGDDALAARHDGVVAPLEPASSVP